MLLVTSSLTSSRASSRSGVGSARTPRARRTSETAAGFACTRRSRRSLPPDSERWLRPSTVTGFPAEGHPTPGWGDYSLARDDAEDRGRSRAVRRGRPGGEPPPLLGRAGSPRLRGAPRSARRGGLWGGGSGRLRHL